MTRFAIDAAVALRLIRSGRTVPDHHQLVAPAGLRSEVLSRLYREVRAGGLADRDARQQLDALAGLKIRLLADRVSRSTAWKIATELDWAEIGPAEYLAVATLQADALVTEDDRLTDQRRVPISAYAELFS
jgi:predicted nucleic acid-binding protein